MEIEIKNPLEAAEIFFNFYYLILDYLPVSGRLAIGFGAALARHFRQILEPYLNLES